MNSKTATIIGIVVLIIIAGALYFFGGKKGTTGAPAVTEHPLKTYYDERYGLAFNFPDNYDITDHDPSATHHVIVLVDKVASSSVPSGSEGPPAMTVDIFSSPKTLLADKWIKSTKESNYDLSQDSSLATTSVNGIPAFAYGWDGLYRSTSIVFPHSGRIYMLSVGYNAPSDQIYKDFAGLVASVQLDP